MEQKIRELEANGNKDETPTGLSRSVNEIRLHAVWIDVAAQNLIHPRGKLAGVFCFQTSLVNQLIFGSHEASSLGTAKHAVFPRRNDFSPEACCVVTRLRYEIAHLQ